MLCGAREGQKEKKGGERRAALRRKDMTPDKNKKQGMIGV
jgi:hypothetical protein